jgi:hypothetical protein
MPHHHRHKKKTQLLSYSDPHIITPRRSIASATNRPERRGKKEGGIKNKSHRTLALLSPCLCTEETNRGRNDHTRRRRNFPDTSDSGARHTHTAYAAVPRQATRPIGQCETVWMGTGPSSASGVHAHPPASTHSSPPGGRVRVAPRTLHVPLDRIEGRRGGDRTGRTRETDGQILLFSSLLWLLRLGVPVLVKERITHTVFLFIRSLFSVSYVGKWQVNNCSITSPERERGKGIKSRDPHWTSGWSKATQPVCVPKRTAPRRRQRQRSQSPTGDRRILFPSIRPPIKFLPFHPFLFHAPLRPTMRPHANRDNGSDRFINRLCLVYFIKNTCLII